MNDILVHIWICKYRRCIVAPWMPMGMTNRYESVVCISLSLLFHHIFLYRLWARGVFVVTSKKDWMNRRDNCPGLLQCTLKNACRLSFTRSKYILSNMEESVRRRRRLPSICCFVIFFIAYAFIFFNGWFFWKREQKSVR